MVETHRSHDIATAEMFRRDPLLAAEYLNTVLADGDDIDIIMALKNLSAAFGDATNTPRHSDSKTPYRATSKQPPPSVITLRTLLSAMGMRLSVQPIE
jgi:DNA-binding phage protein